MSSKRVAWSTLTNSVSKFVSSSFLSPSFLSCSVWNVAYSMTFVKILDGTFGKGMGASVPVSAEGEREEMRGTARFETARGGASGGHGTHHRKG